jgi:hypothetical protein
MKRDGTGGTVVTTLNATTVASTSVTATSISGTNTTSDTYTTTSGTVIIDGSSGSQIRVTDGDVTTYFSVSSVGAVVGASFAGVGSSLTSLNAGNISSGTLVVGRGGTGTTSAPSQGGIIYGSTTSAYGSTAAGTSGQVLQSNGTSAPTWTTLDLSLIPTSTFKKSVRAATTANITLSAPQTIDGISIIAADRVLVKNQSTAANNGLGTDGFSGINKVFNNGLKDGFFPIFHDVQMK